MLVVEELIFTPAKEPFGLYAYSTGRKASVNNRLFYVLIPGRQKKSTIVKKDALCPIRL
jgi:hypothetical protein